MRTWGYNVNKSSALWECFSRNTADTRCMRNTANFYIRNVMTGLRWNGTGKSSGSCAWPEG